jgi:hypothetical protein
MNIISDEALNFCNRGTVLYSTTVQLADLHRDATSPYFWFAFLVLYDVSS